ncbi:uncharacterized protein VP01_80g2, partial [Puccinia sorghi]
MDALNARLDERRRSNELRPASMPSNIPPPRNQIPPPHPTQSSSPNPNPLTAPKAPLPRCSLPKLLYTRSPTQSRDYAATWCQPYLNRIFNGEPLDWTNFLKDLEASFFDHKRQQQAKVALQNIRQTRTVSNYTQDFNQHACAAGWPDTPLMSLYQNGLKEN